MKLKLKFIPDTILAIDGLLFRLFAINAVGSTKEERVLLSIMFELAEIFQKRAKKITHSTDLFNVKKKISITFKYHEAWALEQIIRDVINLEENHYKKNLLQKTADEINQKLL